VYSNFKIILRSIDYRVVVFPLGLMTLFCLLSVAGLYGPPKSVLEMLGLVVLSLFGLVLLTNYLKGKTPFRLWSVGLIVVLLCREIHFYGTSNGAVLGLLILMFLALKYFSHFQDHLTRRAVSSLLFAGFLSYFLSNSIDQRWWRGFPGEDIFHVPVEETLEIIGHTLVGSALMAAQRLSLKQ
jgi:hypothetical protein